MSDLVYDFQIIDTYGNITREGKFSGDALNINVKSGDKLLIILDSSGNVYTKTYLEYHKATYSFVNSLSFYQEGESLTIKNNRYQDGFHLLQYYKVNYPDQLFSIELVAPEATIENLEDARYIFYTENQYGDVSEKTELLFFNSYYEEERDMAFSLLETKTIDTDYIIKEIKNYRADHPDCDLLTCLFSLYHKYYNNKDNNLINESYRILNVLLYLKNSIELRINKIKIDLQSYPKEYVSCEAKHFLLYKVDNEKKYLIGKEYLNNGEKSFVTAFNNLYMLEFYDWSDNMMGTIYHISYPPEIRKKLWQQSLECENKKNNIHYLVDSYLYDNQDFDYYDVEYLIAAINKEPVTNLFNVPTLDYPGKIRCTIDDPMINHLDCYLIIKNYDIFYLPDREIKKKIEANSFYVDFSRNFFFTEDIYCCWIVDKNDNILSNVVYFSVNQEDFVQELNSKIGKSMLAKYKDNFLKSLKETTVYSILDKAFKEMDYEKLNKKMMSYRLLEQTCTPEYMPYYNDIVNHIMEYYLSNSVYDKEFFADPIYYDLASKQVIYPLLSKKYLLEIVRINLGEEISYDYQSVNYTDVYAHVLVNADFMIISAIDPDTYEKSGYIYINNLYDKRYVNYWNIDFRVI